MECDSLVILWDMWESAAVYCILGYCILGYFGHILVNSSSKESEPGIKVGGPEMFAENGV